MKCTQRITDGMVKANFDQYYAFLDPDAKRLFLDKRIRPRSAKRPRTKENPKGRINYEYIIYDGQEEHIVCRTAFNRIFGVSRAVCSHIIGTRKDNPAGTPKPDARGRGK